MDPLNIQMVIGSPHALRSKTSLSALIGRKKKASHSNKVSAKGTPSQLTKIDEDSQSLSTGSDTVRTRRGFRPLSVFTNSILVPFESEALKAMDELESAKGTAAGDLIDPLESLTFVEDESSTAESPPKHSAPARVPPSSSDSEMSIRAFLAQSSPPSTSNVIKAPFSMLHGIPAPDLSQHPMFADDPFASQSDAPSFITTSSVGEIKKYAAQARSNSSNLTDRTSTSSDIFGSIERNKFVFREQQPSPSTPSKPRPSSTTNSSPLSRIYPRSCPIEIPYNSPYTPNADLEKKRSGSGGIRKLSDMFKSRSSSEQSGPTSPLSPPVLYKPLRDLEYYLRTVTVTPTFEHNEKSSYPPHPVTGRGWRSRNLKCTTCVDVSCGCCGRTCCAYKAAVMALDHHKGESRATALERIQHITSLYPYGRELPTFLLCTKDVVEGRGCGKLVCPECCGACPNEICADIQCRKCKKDPWAECDWHEHETQQTPVTADSTTTTRRDTSMRRTV